MDFYSTLFFTLLRMKSLGQAYSRSTTSVFDKCTKILGNRLRSIWLWYFIDDYSRCITPTVFIILYRNIPCHRKETERWPHYRSTIARSRCVRELLYSLPCFSTSVLVIFFSLKFCFTWNRREKNRYVFRCLYEFFFFFTKL